MTRRFLRAKGWQDTQRIVVGGGFRQGRIGELVIGRTNGLLKGSRARGETHAHPPSPGSRRDHRLRATRAPWTLSGYQAIIGVDIGGSNIRAGVVE